ncbi:MAG: glycosyltransferase family 39 protein [Phaeodactylibacter sp.]|uniref:ArnT family glycosyltransferase n=1 Tax=Phaeodactylibacter sp. TaxID=1940289 RepID=UPI0032EAF49B
MQLSDSTKALGIFLFVAVAIRLISFFPSVIDHDESTYLVIADAIAQGYTYQVDYIDTKPIGIFLILAALKSLLGNAIWGYRLFAALVLGLTSFLLYRAKRIQGSSWAAALSAGIIYLILNSLYTRYGVSPNTETYFNLFTAGALLLFFKYRSFLAFFAAGLLLGIGFVIKYVVLFDGLAFGGFLLFQALRREGNVVRALGRALTMALGAALPFAAVVGYYYQIGEFDRFWFNSITVAGRYPSSRAFIHYIVFFFEFFLRFLPVTVLFVVSIWHKKTDLTVRQFGLIWSALVLLSVLIPGNAFGHYYIQFMLPFSYLAGEFFGLPRQAVPRWLQWMRNPKIGYPLLGLLFITHLFLQKKDYLDRPDNVRYAAAYINERIKPGEAIYTQEDQAIYFLTARLPLLPYVHPSLFWMDKHIEAMEIDVPLEVAKIEAARPRFMVFRYPVETERFAVYRAAHYDRVANIGDYVVIFERKD